MDLVDFFMNYNDSAKIVEITTPHYVQTFLDFHRDTVSLYGNLEKTFDQPSFDNSFCFREIPGRGGGGHFGI